MLNHAHLLAALACLQLRAGAVFMAPASIESLRSRQQELQAASEALVASADGEDRDLTDEELETIETNRGEIEKVSRQISARETAAAVTAAPTRRTAAEPANAARTTVPAQARGADAARNGFRSFGEFAATVRHGSTPGAQVDSRLLNVATTFGNESTGAEGGFAVPAEFRRDIWQKVMGEENLLNRTDRLTTGGNNLTIPKDETTPWQNTGGVLAYWESEAGQVTASKPALEMATIRLNKLMALVPVSDELLEDAPGLESWLRAKAPAKMAAKLNTAIIDGTGVGQPLGILKAPSLITVSKETSQVADTVLFANINKMWSRMYAPCRRNAVWLINQDVEPQLDAMAFDPDASSKVPAYLPPGGLSASPYATLKGRPVVPVEACKTLGDKGDMILVDLAQYMSLAKGQEVKTDVSMHLYFDQALQAFRFIFRVAGQPWWGSAVTPQNGALTRSWAVALEERS